MHLHRLKEMEMGRKEKSMRYKEEGKNTIWRKQWGEKSSDGNKIKQQYWKDGSVVEKEQLSDSAPCSNALSILLIGHTNTFTRTKN